jgi:hypothetical protein
MVTSDVKNTEALVECVHAFVNFEFGLFMRSVERCHTVIMMDGISIIVLQKTINPLSFD